MIYMSSLIQLAYLLDGAGLDTIIVSGNSRDATIDLRSGAHSHLGANYITDANQLTISHGSDIENVVTGPGNDTGVIGTHLDNVIETGSGSDVIYAGVDIIKSGNGADRIDLSESMQSLDTIILNVS